MLFSTSTLLLAVASAAQVSAFTYDMVKSHLTEVVSGSCCVEERTDFCADTKFSPTDGLNSQGMERAQCLRNVFGASSGYNIGYIITQDYKSDGSRERPFETVTPLASDLGLKIDHHCDRDDTDCAQNSIDDYAKSHSGNILVCWEHDALDDIADALGAKINYPDDHYDLIYEIKNKDLTSNSPYSENCPGLDN